MCTDILFKMFYDRLLKNSVVLECSAHCDHSFMQLRLFLIQEGNHCYYKNPLISQITIALQVLFLQSV